MVDFDDLKGKAESLLGEHADQVEGGIDKLADLAGKQFGHAGQIDQAAEKLKGFVDDQQDGARANRPGPGPRAGGRPQPRQGTGAGPRAGGKGKRKGQRPAPPEHAS
ncbi:MAG: hypothetical protein QOI15_1326 [Pseudonocardiales bacterium]|nr:hypothetical protein [Pseudonocardiales bacterium]